MNAVFLRLSRRSAAVCLVGVSLLLHSSAKAQTETMSAPKVDADMTVEIRFGPYRPNIDSAFSGKTPYQDVFGDSTRYLFGAEVDWQALHFNHVGSLGLGGAVSYTRASGTALFADGTGESGESTSLSVWPFALLGVFRLDGPSKDLGIPLVPYGKFGFALALWSASNDLGTSRANDERLGRGRTFGLQYAVGLSLKLDFLDPAAAKTFAIERGVIHSYAFFEYTVTDLSGLGQTGAMRLGDKTWNLGVAFDL